MTASAPPALDLDSVRNRFPALRRQVGGRPAAYFDGPGGSQVPEVVIEAMSSYLERSNANAGGAFASSRETDELLAEAHRAAGDFVGAEADEIAFGANMTTLNFLLSHALARTLVPGDEIVVTELDHDANVSPWFRAAEDRDLRIRVAPIDPADGALDLNALEGLIGERTRVVAYTLASNALGNVCDSARIAAAAHRVGALAWADGVHLAPHRRLDREALGADVLLCSPYKFFGPHLGLAAIRRDLAQSLPADRGRAPAPEPPGHRFETGTLSHEALAGAVAAIDYLAGLAGPDGDRRERLDTAFGAIRAHEEGLTLRFLAALEQLDGVRLHGITDPGRVGERTPTFLLELAGKRPAAAAAELGERGMVTWDGHFYAVGPLKRLGLLPDGGLRVGFLHYTTPDEVDDLAGALAELA
ncbi:MAG: cysteine desulfurase-like protein [Solirubrobacterales bacterium]